MSEWIKSFEKSSNYSWIEQSGKILDVFIEEDFGTIIYLMDGNALRLIRAFPVGDAWLVSVDVQTNDHIEFLTGILPRLMDGACYKKAYPSLKPSDYEEFWEND